MKKNSLLVLVDRNRTEEYILARETVFAALDHFGMVYEAIDLSEQPLTREIMTPFSAVVVAQRGTAASSLGEIGEFVSAGGGVVDFCDDPYEDAGFADDTATLFATERGLFTSLRAGEHSHYITDSYEEGVSFELKRPLEFLQMEGTAPSGVSVVLQSAEGDPLSIAFRHGEGKVVKCLFPLEFWQPEYFGHARGLDTFFYRAIVWAARKPFITMAMPPFITARVDDCSGTGSGYAKHADSAARSFRYIDLFNKYGYIPNIGLFTDDIVTEDGAILKEKYEKHLAEFSAHAFSEDVRGEDNLIYVKHIHDEGGTIVGVEEYSPSRLSEAFRKLDGQFDRWGIKPSKTVNSHYQNPGLHALPFLADRGEVYMMATSRFGASYYDPETYNWNPKPYGRPGFVCDYMVDHPGFFIVEAHPYEVSQEGKIADADIDMLWSNTIFGNENPVNNPEAAAEKAITGIKRGLDGMFFGCVFTHEQRIACLSTDEWERVLERIHSYTREHGLLFRAYDYISEYSKSRYDTRIISSDYNAQANTILLQVKGSATVALTVQLFTDEGESCVQHTREIPPFKSGQRVSLALP